MTRVLVYVEGPSDKLGLEALLRPLLTDLARKGVGVDFFPGGPGDAKKAVLLKVPEKAVNILRSQPRTVVVAMPDLYPKNRGFPHDTWDQLRDGLRERFRSSLERKGVRDGARLEERFQVFCFKHDMEALLLAAHESLEARLAAPGLVRSWPEPVEDINHHRPPKRIVEEIFQKHGQRYRDTVDAPVILGASDYRSVARVCSQCFSPFVDFLISLA